MRRRPGITLSSRDRRALRVGALLAAPVLAWNVAVKPYMAALTSARDEVRVQRDLLARELELVATAQRYPAALTRAEGLLSVTASRLFTGPDDVSATAALAHYVSNQARESRVVVQQVETRSSEALGDGVVGLDMALRAEGDLEGIVTLLRRLESGSKFVRVEQIAVEQGNARVIAEASPESETLTIAATIRGFAPARVDSTATNAGSVGSRVADRRSQ